MSLLTSLSYLITTLATTFCNNFTKTILSVINLVILLHMTNLRVRVEILTCS
uniref:Uncharacterized protein n=1 Tax=Arundo donax TaxID=35708 RepID=A0A0A9BRM1_ARUDO